MNRRTFIKTTATGLTAPELLAQMSPLDAILFSPTDWTATSSLCKAGGLNILNSHHEHAFDSALMTRAETVVIADFNIKELPNIPAHKPIYWLSGFPADKRELNQFLNARAEGLVRFSLPTSTNPVLRGLLETGDLAVQQTMAYSYGVSGVLGRDGLCRQLAQLCYLMGQEDFETHSISFAGNSAVSITLQPSRKSFGWAITAGTFARRGERLIMADHLVEIHHCDGQTYCSVVPSPAGPSDIAASLSWIRRANEVGCKRNEIIDNLRDWVTLVRSGNCSPSYYGESRQPHRVVKLLGIVDEVTGMLCKTESTSRHFT